MRILLSVLFVLLGSSLAMGTGNISPNDSLLITAAKNGDTFSVRSLIHHYGADVNKTDKNNATPLHWATEKGHSDIVAILLDKGADVNKADNVGWTPLHWAALNGHTAVAGRLIEKGADVNAAGDGGWTPLHLAAMNGHTAVAELLIEKKVDVNAVDGLGWTPSRWAAEKGHTDVAELLLNNGAKVNEIDNAGDTPRSLATKNGHRDVVVLLRSHIWKPRLKNAGIVGLTSVALVGAAVVGYKYFVSTPESVVETLDDEIIGAMDANVDFIPDGADPALLPESDLIPDL